MPPLQSAGSRTSAGRKRRGDYPTPDWLVDDVVRHVVDGLARTPGRPGPALTVLDPACGDGRFLVAAGRALLAAGADVELVGVDIDRGAVAAAGQAIAGSGLDLRWRVEHADALSKEWDEGSVDVVVGNPPYLSQMASATTRGGASAHGGGPYADAAAEFLGLAGRVVRPGGRIGLVLPQSILASRDAAAVRAAIDRRATITWSWWSPTHAFDAQVLVCALVFAARQAGGPAAPARSWSEVVTSRLRVPAVPALHAVGRLGDLVRLTANFRDQYYGLVPAVVEDGSGPPFVTSGLVDPGHCAWGERDVTFAKRRFGRPTVDLDRLDARMRRWADDLLVPKVLVANQTRVIEAVADPDGRLLPGVPLVTARPLAGDDVWRVAAVLTSPVASAWAWHRAAGTGLSADTIRLGPRWLVDLPWPAGDLAPAATALRDGDVVGCGLAVMDAYGVGGDAELASWWTERLGRGRRVPGRGSHIGDTAQP
ncbi:MAG: N-6 DNA methylase [Ilumatobacteraceae bacterium]